MGTFIAFVLIIVVVVVIVSINKSSKKESPPPPVINIKPVLIKIDKYSSRKCLERFRDAWHDNYLLYKPFLNDFYKEFGNKAQYCLNMMKKAQSYLDVIDKNERFLNKNKCLIQGKMTLFIQSLYQKYLDAQLVIEIMGDDASIDLIEERNFLYNKHECSMDLAELLRKTGDAITSQEESVKKFEENIKASKELYERVSKQDTSNTIYDNDLGEMKFRDRRAEENARSYLLSLKSDIETKEEKLVRMKKDLDARKVSFAEFVANVDRNINVEE